MENMEIYNSARSVPENAKKPIKGGRLKGMTDINPMWRIQTLTDLFGPCGIGWKYIIKDKRLEAGANGEIAAFVDIDLYYKAGDLWSEAVPGTGGASFVAKEGGGLHTSDECFKMALTDALSVAFKNLGGGADVYWADGRTKYNCGDGTGGTQDDSGGFQSADILCDKCGGIIFPIAKNGKVVKTVAQMTEYTKKEFGFNLCYNCMRKAKDDGA